MTNIIINLGGLSKREAVALSAMLGALTFEEAGRSHADNISKNETTEPKPNAREKVYPPIELAEQLEVIELKCEEVLATSAGSGDHAADAAVYTAGPAATEPAKRTRRTKAEMEAARAQELAASEPKQHQETAKEPAASVALAGHGAPTLDQLRDALQTYNEKKGMPAAIELLKDFGVSRASELQVLPVEEQINFLKCANA